MPGFNQTGPTGEGPMTGRRMGRCSNLGARSGNQTTKPDGNTIESMPEVFQGRGFGRGRRRRGFGMGRQNRFGD